MDVDLDVLHDLLFETVGFTVNGISEVLQAARVRSRIKHLKLSSFQAYLEQLRGRESAEIQQLINVLTVGETYFFRDYDQLQHFAEEVLPATATRKEATGRRIIRVLCAGCSSGEEAYTLSIILREMLEETPPWRISIDAIDINTAQIERAKQGRYSPRTLRFVPLAYKNRYFELVDDRFAALDTIRDGVNFNCLNLLDSEQMSEYRDYDFVFCRNVLIYLDRNQKEILVHQLHRCLLPKGILFIAATESLGQISSAFRYRKLGSCFVYQKD